MSVRKAIYQFIHEDLDRETGKTLSPVPFIDCGCEWAERSSPALPQGTGTGCTSEMGECLSSLHRFSLKINRPSMGADEDSCLRRACSSHLTARSSEEDTPQRVPRLCRDSHKDLHSHCS